MNLFDLSGRVAFIAGRVEESGWRSPRACWRRARVVVHGRDPDRAASAAETLTTVTGGETLVSTFELTDNQGLGELGGEVARRDGVGLDSGWCQIGGGMTAVV